MRQGAGEIEGVCVCSDWLIEAQARAIEDDLVDVLDRAGFSALRSLEAIEQTVVWQVGGSLRRN